MIVDSSVLLAIVYRRDGFADLIERIVHSSVAAIGAPTVAETAIVLHAELGDGGRGLVERLIDELGLDVLPFGDDEWREAVDGYRRFGKGQHPAKLTFANCMTYATSRLSGHPLLFVGGGFSKTDLEPA